LEGTILMPYFWSKPMCAATTMGAQSVSGMKPNLTSLISGASLPAAQAWLRICSGTMPISAEAPMTPALARKKLRRPLSMRSLSFETLAGACWSSLLICFS